MARQRNCAGDRKARRGSPQSGGQTEILSGSERTRVPPPQLLHSARNATRHSNQTLRQIVGLVLAPQSAKTEAAPALWTEPKSAPPHVQELRLGSAAPRT